MTKTIEDGFTSIRPKRHWIPVITAIAGLLVGVSSLATVAGLYFTHKSIDETNTQLAIAEQGQVTDRYNSAVTNLGSSDLVVRIGGIYALQRVMHDSPRDQPAILQVLTAYVRNHAPLGAGGHSRVSVDVQSALTVIGTRNPAYDQFSYIDLENADLAGVNMADLNFDSADLDGAVLDHANLQRASFSGATFRSASLKDAMLEDARLTTGIVGPLKYEVVKNKESSNNITQSADLTEANLSGADLQRADFSGATLDHTDLSGADLACADFSDSQLYSDNFSKAKISITNLEGADIENPIGQKVIAQRAPKSDLCSE
jgi:Pentapeptide repeats (8 copies)